MRFVAARRGDDRGAVAVVAAVVFAMVLTVIAGFAVDLGGQRVVRRDMQSLADVVALDMSRQLDGKTGASALVASPTWKAALDKSLARNTGTYGGTPNVTAVVGTVSASGVFTQLTDSTVPSAVQVTAGASVGFAFGVASSGSATRSSVAMVKSGACIRVGSYIASVNTQQSMLLNSIMSGLLGSNLSLTAGDYTGLAGLNVTLADLATIGGLSVGTPADVLALKNVSVGDFNVAVAKVLDAQGKGSYATLLRNITVAATTPTIAIGDLVSAAPGDSSALNASLNVLSLITGAAELSNVNKGTAVGLQNVGINIPGVANPQVNLQVISPPQIACGGVGATAKTAQVKLTVTVPIPAQTVNIPLLNTNVSLAATPLTFSINLGQALATLASVSCVAGAVNSLGVNLNSGVVGALSLTSALNLTANFGVPLTSGSGLLGTLLTDILSSLGLSALGSLLSTPTLSLNAALGVTAGTSSPYTTQALTLKIPDNYTKAVGSKSGDLVGTPQLSPSLSTSLSLTYKTLLGGVQTQTILSTDGLFKDVLTPIISTLTTSLLQPIVDAINSNLLPQLESLLGLQLGGADVWAVPTPTCGNPALVG